MYDLAEAVYKVYDSKNKEAASFTTYKGTTGKNTMYVGVPKVTAYGSGIGVTAVTDTSSVSSITTANNYLVLPLGTYTVKETKAPSGYELSSIVYEIIISAGNAKAEQTVTYNGTTTDYTKEGKALIPGTDLPYYPEIGTALTDKATDEHISCADEDITLVDTVSYKNLIVGKKYTVKGVLMDRETGKELTDANGKEITAESSFTAEKEDGTVDVTFTFDGSNLAGKEAVAFETMYYEDIEIAAHADLNDDFQTVYFPEIGTTLIDEATDEHISCADEDITLVDTVSYKNLIVGKKYTVKGVLMDRETGKELTDANGKEITAESSFTAEKEDGTVDVTFTFDGSNLAGKEAVAFETMYYEDIEIAAHADLNDDFQTVYFPEIGTTLIDEATDEHIAYADEDVTLVDTVSYKNLIVGKEYTVKGVLMDRETGKKLTDANGKEIAAETTFIAETESGTVEAVFSF